VEDFEQVAEWQGKTDPDLVAEEAYRIGRIFNNALAAPEITGGWGFTVDQALKRLRYPNLYTHTAWDRISKKWTDRTGWDTQTRNRANMLDTLEMVLRERQFGLFSPRAVAELGAFVYEKRKDGTLGRPEARDGANDDLVMALAIAVTIAFAKRPTRKKGRRGNMVGLGRG
jgi:phage terminase large subunit